MNQEKIGKFIAECRKKKKLTQSELAEKLGVSDRAVSKWENGINLPNISLFEPLCKELGINLNDLISGHIVEEKEYKKTSEENIINTIDYSKNEIKKVKYNIIKLICLIILVFLVSDTIIAIIGKYSPLIHKRENVMDMDSYVDRGLFIDTFYCVFEKDIVTVSYHFKFSKYTCPIDNNEELNEIPDVRMYIKDGTLTPSGAKIIIKDESKKYAFGYPYRLDKKVDGVWEPLEIICENCAFALPSLGTDEKGELEMLCNWGKMYGRLPIGYYRIVKDTYTLDTNEKKYFSVEFLIN